MRCLIPRLIGCGVLMLLSFVDVLSASRILLIPPAHKSHVAFFALIGRTLQDAGHDVKVLVLDSRKGLVEKQKLSCITYPCPDDAPSLLNEDVYQKLALTASVNVLKTFADMTKEQNALCESIHQNDELIGVIEAAHYDIVLIDGIDFSRCFYSIPYRIGVPYITLTARHDPWHAGLASLPSVEPLLGFSEIKPDSNIFDRIKHLVMHVMVNMLLPPSTLDESMIARYAPTKPSVTFKELFSRSEMWLVNLDTICIDWPRAYGNHYQYIAGMSNEPAKPLPDSLDEFVRDSKRGIIILTFGSALKNIPQDILAKMLHAFAQVEFRVVMRHAGEKPDKIPANVKMMDWIPQGDLLGHPKARVFITHGGANGQMESLYHAVPMINIPMFGDQVYNAKRVESKGFGLTLFHETFTSEDLLHAINNITKDKSYRDKIRRCSERFRSLPAAQDTITFWVEHIIRFGGAHLKPASLELPLWKMFMLDILALFLLILLICYTLCICCCLKLFRKCSKRGITESGKKTE